MRFVFACHFFLVFVLSPASGVAQAEGSSAQRLFEEGVQAYDQESYAEALRLFTESYEARESQLVLFNLAVTEQRLGREEDALFHLQVWLSRDDGSDPGRTAAAREAIAELAPQLVRLRVTVTPENATVTIDGAPARITEDGVIVLRPGLYQVGAEASGYAPTSERVTLEAGTERSISLELSEAPESEATPAPPSTGDEPPPGPSPVPWIVMGTGLAAVAAGVVTGIITLGKHSDLSESCPSNPCPEDVEDEKASGQTLALVTDILLFGGAAIAVTGLVLLFVLREDDDEDLDVAVPSLSCGANGCIGGVSGTF